jgi:hypothetical protein
MFASKLELFSIGTISLSLKTGIDIVVINIIHLERTMAIVNSTIELSYNFIRSAKIAIDMKPKVNLEGKVYFETYYYHTPNQV